MDAAVPGLWATVNPVRGIEFLAARANLRF